MYRAHFIEHETFQTGFQIRIYNILVQLYIESYL